MKKYWQAILLAIIIRLLLSLITFHPDIQAFNLAGKIVSEGNILNLYDYLPSLPWQDPIKNIAVLNYPPAIYFFHGIFNFIFRILGLPINQFLLDSINNYGNIIFNFHLLLLKLPYLIFDLLTVFVMYRLFTSERQKKLVLLFWLFNPINLYATFMMGQFDIIPTFFSVLSIYYIFKNKLNLSAFSLGIGIAFKLYPVFLIVPLIILGKNLFEKSKLFMLCLLPYLLTILPYLSSHNFRSTALFANQSSKSLYAQIPVSGGESIVLFPTFLILFYLIIFLAKEKFITWKMYAIPLLLFFIFTHFHPQWLIWITPFLIIGIVNTGISTIIPVIMILLSFFGSLFFFDPSLTIGLFAPLFPILHNVLSIWELLRITPDYNFLRSILQTIFTGSSLYLIYIYFLDKTSE